RSSVGAMPRSERSPGGGWSSLGSIVLVSPEGKTILRLSPDTLTLSPPGPTVRALGRGGSLTGFADVVAGGASGTVGGMSGPEPHAPATRPSPRPAPIARANRRAITAPLEEARCVRPRPWQGRR